MADKIEYEVDVKINTDQADKAVSSFGTKIQKGLGGVSSKIESMGDKFSSLPGPIGSSASALTSLGKSAMAFVANPIGAIVAAIAIVFMAMYNAMKKTEAGMDALNELTAVFGAFIKPIIKAVADLATLLVNGLASALEFVGELFGANTSEARNLAKELDNLEDQEQSLSIARAQQNKDLAKARELLSDSNATIEERRKALDKVSKSETDLAAKELKHAQDYLKAQKALQAQDGVNEENKKAIAAATIKVLEAETELAQKKRLFNKEAKKLDAEEEAAKKEAAEEAERKAKELAEKQKQYADERRDAEDKLRAMRQRNLLADIKDETDKATKQAELDKENALREISRSKMTKKEKADANILIEQQYQQTISKIQEDASQKAKDKAEKEIKELSDRKKEALDKEVQLINESAEREKILKNQTISDENALAEAIYQIELNKLTKILDARKALGESTIEQEKAIAELTINENKRVATQKEKLDKLEQDREAQKLEAAKTFFTGIAAIAGENTKAAVAAQIGSAVIDTYVAANKALASAPPPLNYVMMAGVVMSGIANVKKIIEESKKIGAETGGAESAASGISATGPSISIAGGQVVNSASQLSDSISNAMNKPQRSYVIGSDVSTQQGLDRKISQNATLGW